MRIGILGSGDVGRTLAAGLHATGHEVTVGSRTPAAADLVAWCERTGVTAALPAETAAAAEVVVLATAWNGVPDAIALAGPERLAGKVLIDVTNPLRFTDRLELAVGHDDSGGEQVQRLAPGAMVVKAFNTVGFELMVQPALADGPGTMFIAGDDERARAVTTVLARQLGWAVHDCGGLRAARLTEPLAMLWIEHALRTGVRSHAFRVIGVEAEG
ncbi:MAG: NAD(P)-binding domain-containing protein [Acidimicrobiales bacterium]|nr:NAD(P)-binding domain-containing protein [Acidimicrobiales bacterium]